MTTSSGGGLRTIAFAASQAEDVEIEKHWVVRETLAENPKKT